MMMMMTKMVMMMMQIKFIFIYFILCIYHKTLTVFLTHVRYYCKEIAIHVRGKISRNVRDLTRGGTNCIEGAYKMQ